MKKLNAIFTLFFLLFTSVWGAHQEGFCALYGNCGKKSLFGSELPCPVNIPAQTPDEETRNAIVDICGSEFADGPVCCDLNQVAALKTNLKKAENIISSCPACKENFFNLFCRFTCSPDQSLFVNATTIGKSSSGKDIVTELDHYVAPDKAEAFYDSCKEVKFAATNGYAMDLIGGGAKDYQAFFKFLGDEKPLLGGSPFQMNFPWDSTPDEIVRQNGPVYSCSDETFRCACSDCSASCPELNHLSPSNQCKVGILPCLSFAVVIFYSAILATAIIGFGIYHLLSRNATFGVGAVRLLEDDSEEESTANQSFWTRSLFRESDRLNGPYKLNSLLQKWFSQLALFVATFPRLIIGVTFFAVVILSLGILNLSLEKEPAKLWVSADSREAKEKTLFDESFGPFYRNQQIYLVNETGPVLSYDNIKWWFEVENYISHELTANSELGPVGLADICFSPLGDECVIESFTQYFGGNIALLPEPTWKQKISSCAKSPVSCLPPFQQPLKPSLIFGDYEDEDVLTSKALVTTFVVNNNVSQSSDQIIHSLAWESSLESYLLDVQSQAAERGLRLSFSTESSLEKELNKSSNTDANIIIISYVFMFLYASLALGGVLPGFSKSSLVKTKFSLGLFGILVVLMSVTSSVGLFATLGVKATLIIAEVIPFLVLAVGVDNIFLLTHELESVRISHPNDSVEQRISKSVGRIGPSILLSTCCEILAFSLGATVAMPAVRNFAIYSAGAVFFNSVLQLTMFVAALTLDQRRVDDNRVDCFPFTRAPKTVSNRESFSTITARMLGSAGVLEKINEPTFSRLIRRYYAPYLLKKPVKRTLVALFVVWTSISVALLPRIELGLDQRLAVPVDSYLVSYFDDLYDYFNTGPPVYFVTHGDEYDITSREGQQQVCGRYSACEEFSLVNIIEQERKRPEVSYLVDPAASWIDDFLQWLNPELDECCRFKKNTNQTEMCSPFASPRVCEVCFKDKQWDTYMDGFPEGDEFMRYFSYWIEAPSDPCPLGGKAPYGTAVKADYEAGKITASSFRTAHGPLRSQADFINSYAAARRVADEINRSTDVPVFPYSPHYIFFAQYETIVKDSVSLIGGAIGAIFLLSAIILGSLRTAFVVAVTVVMIVVNVAGVMAVWGVGLNAVSLVNLVICVGLGVEFCIHIARTFTFAFKSNGTTEQYGGSRNERAFGALVGVGGSVFGGIALTKLIGVTVLAFTRSRIFEVYYFRMWLALVLVATSHSLAFLPVALSYAGGAGYIVEQRGQGVAEDLASRVYDGGYHDEED